MLLHNLNLVRAPTRDICYLYKLNLRSELPRHDTQSHTDRLYTLTRRGYFEGDHEGTPRAETIGEAACEAKGWRSAGQFSCDTKGGQYV